MDPDRPVAITIKKRLLHGSQRGVLLQVANGHQVGWSLIELYGDQWPDVRSAMLRNPYDCNRRNRPHMMISIMFWTLTSSLLAFWMLLFVGWSFSEWDTDDGGSVGLEPVPPMDEDDWHDCS